MDIAFSAEDLAFRDEVRAFLTTPLLMSLLLDCVAKILKRRLLSGRKNCMPKAGSPPIGRLSTVARVGRQRKSISTSPSVLRQVYPARFLLASTWLARLSTSLAPQSKRAFPTPYLKQR